LVLTEFPCVVLWRPEALDCRVLIPPEAWSWLSRNPPSVGLEPGPPASEIGSLTNRLRWRVLQRMAMDAGAYVETKPEQTTAVSS